MKKLPEKTLSVGGFVPFTTVDFPGRLAAVVFCQGCPWRCGYCHNKHLQGFSAGKLAWNQVMDFLRRRANLLEAVVFSGGEPLAQPALPRAMEEVRELGFAVGLHTTGLSPARLRRVLPLVDWIGLDVKAPAGRYSEVTGSEVTGSEVTGSEVTGAQRARAVYRSLAALLAAGVRYQVRTTVDRTLLRDADLAQMKDELASAGVAGWTLQACKPAPALSPETP